MTNAQTLPPAELHCIDFDGTISNTDSFMQFVQFAKGSFRLYGLLVILSPLFVVEMIFPSLSGVTKQTVLSILFKGYSRAKLEELGEHFFLTKLKNTLRPKAMEVINELLKNKHTVVIVSASVDFWLQPVACYLNTELICTRAEYKNGIFTGRFSTKNCKGAEKANRLKQQYPISNYHLTAYGNSAGDKGMFQLANQKFLHPFAGQRKGLFSFDKG